MKTILIIEDDKNLGETLKDYFEYKGYKAYWSENAEYGLELFKKHSPDLIVLDVILPDKNGLEVIEEIRKTNTIIPVILMTGTELETKSQIKAYNHGAANYYKKPVNPEILMAQIEALLSIPGEKSFVIGKNRIVLDSQRLLLNDNEYQLREKDALVLDCLLSNESRLLSRHEIIKTVWPDYHYKDVDNMLDSAISRLKKLLSGQDELTISSIYGKGYTINFKRSDKN